MKWLILEYGKILVSVLVGVFLVAVLCTVFIPFWRKTGGVEDVQKTNFYSNERKRVAPTLDVKDFKIKKGEKVELINYVSAVDFDGKDISESVEIAVCAEGEKENYYDIQAERWDGIGSQIGVFRFFLRVQSPVTSKVTRGKMVVLVDAMEGE